MSRRHNTTALTAIELSQHPHTTSGNHPRERKSLAIVATIPFTDPQHFARYREHRTRMAMPVDVEDIFEPPEYPPSLPRNRTVPLPALADVPIYIHPLLHYHPTALAIVFDFTLPPSTAHAPSSKTHIEYRGWRRQPAMDPSTIGSITIRMAGVERPIVVLPSRGNTAIVTIEDVLGAVYHAAREAGANEVLRTNDDPFRLRRRRYSQTHAQGSRGQFDTEDQITATVRARFRGRHWWAGIFPSQTERDVWVLHTTEYGPR